MSQEKTVQALSCLLADSYTLYTKTHNFHWNVTGPMFTTLHTLFETQYTELAMAVDEIAERIRALGARAPGSYSEFGQLAKVKESTGKVAATAMIEELVADQERIVEAAKAVIEAAGEVGDEPSVDLGVQRMTLHQKNAWMLRSHVE
jgi:starvation-inducible DNA-binding protein